MIAFHKEIKMKQKKKQKTEPILCRIKKERWYERRGPQTFVVGALFLGLYAWLPKHDIVMLGIGCFFLGAWFREVILR